MRYRGEHGDLAALGVSILVDQRANLIVGVRWAPEVIYRREPASDDAGLTLRDPIGPIAPRAGRAELAYGGLVCCTLIAISPCPPQLI